MILAHIGPFPVEEMLPYFAPVGMVSIPATLASFRERRRDCREAERKERSETDLKDRSHSGLRSVA